MRIAARCVGQVIVLCVLAAIGAAHAAADGTTRVACVGDSITFGYGLEDRERDSYPAQLQALLGKGWEVGNFGRSGARVTNDSPNPYRWSAEHAAALAFEPEVVVICLGINDCSVPEWPRNRGPFAEDLRFLLREFAAVPSRPRVLLGSLMPVVQPYEPYLGIRANMAECSAFIERVATEERVGVVDLMTPLESEPQLYSDGLHPSAAGAGMIAERVYRAITGDYGGLRLPWVFGDRMVLQRDKPIPVFGTADAGSRVEVRLGPDRREVGADINGRWRVDLPARGATADPLILTVTDGHSTKTFADVLVGEVWLAAGQSNMDWPCERDADWAEQGPLAAKAPRVRLLNRTGRPHPGGGRWSQEQLSRLTVDDYFSGRWTVCTPESAAGFSAVAYHFAQQIHRATGVPVGLIECAVGGASMEAYMPRTALDRPELYGLMENWAEPRETPAWHRERARENLGGSRGAPPHHPFEPTFLFHAGIRPIAPFGLRGIIWYQGETNATSTADGPPCDPRVNALLFGSLIRSWREAWNDETLPFGYVQLPNLNRQWMLFREMQLQTLGRLPNLGMAVTIDLGDPTDVHPPAKGEVGRRLSLWARSEVYGEQGLVYSGPLLAGACVFRGGSASLRFDHAGDGLVAADGGEIVGFELAGDDGIWKRARAQADGAFVTVSSDNVSHAVAVRYAWAPNPVANLVNTEGLPASPFRAGKRWPADAEAR